jgi:GT2 family glycosyltransferase
MVSKMISIITPIWNQANLTHQYLLLNEMHYQNDPGVQWIIINNGSTDGTGGTLEYFKDILNDRLIVLKNKTNEGFPRACNQGAARADGDMLLFLNNDIIIKGDYITPLEKALADNPHSLAGPQLANVDTGWNVFGDKLISYLIGWCMAMPKEIFDDLGGFDERYTPAYYEDVDLCYNALQSGYDLQQVWVPLQHLGEQSGKQFDDREKITRANRIKFAEKWGLKL